MAKITGKKCDFLVSKTGATPAYASLGQIMSIGGISQTSDEVDATTLEATDFRDFIQGFKDPGECSVTLAWDPTLVGHGSAAGGVISYFKTGETVRCAIKLNYTTPKYLLFDAFVRDMNYPEINPDDVVTLNPVFRVKTDVTLADTLPVTFASEGVGAEPQFAKAA